MRARVTFFVVFFALVAAVPVIASADDRVLHDRLPPVGAAELSALFEQAQGGPVASLSSDAPMRGEPSESQPTPPAGRRMQSYGPDRQTRFEGNADYYEVFAPSISPYKRVSALDAVELAADGVTPVLVTSRGARRTVPVLSAAEAARDADERDSFWGRVTLDFAGGTQLPLPSVSPDARLLGLRASPEHALRVEKDAADNYYVVSSQPLRQSVALEFLTDAPRAYFGGPVADADRSTLAPFAMPLPPSVRVRALAFAAELGIGTRTRYKAALERLVEHFRSFVESDDPPQNTGDAYLDLSRGKRGVCRHRAYGFVITALGLGIPARFVSNEAHAWVEVMLPSRAWRRIDLGGAAQGLRSHEREQTARYEPRVDDALPRPAEYVAAYAAASEARRREADGRAPSSTGTASSNASARAELPAGWRRTDEPEPPGPRDAQAPRVHVTLSLDEPARTTFRGREMFVSGRAVDATGAPASALRIEISLLASRGDRYLPLGVTATGDDGRFRVSVGVPRDVSPGDYRLYVATPGDRRYGPSRVE